MNETLLVLTKLAEERRTILSNWRAHLLLRRHEDPHLTEETARKIVRKLERDGMIEAIPGTRSQLHRVTAPYAPSVVNVHELIGEAYTAGAFCYATAYEIHRLTDQRSSTLHLFLPAIAPKGIVKTTTREGSTAGAADPIPIGTTPAEWRLHPLPGSVKLKGYGSYTIDTHPVKEEWWFGFVEREVEGVALRVTDLERTLIDGLRFPKHCGGLNGVFLGWVRALDILSADRLVDHVERFGRTILYQRVGFVMETLGLSHPRLAAWKSDNVARGGSRRLDPEGPYGATYDEAWQLSINHPTAILTNRETHYS